MMKTRVAGWLCMLAALVLAGCAGTGHKLESPRVTLTSIDAVDIQLLEQRFELTLRIQNPNEEPLQIKGLSFSLELNGEDFAQGVSNQAVSVGAYDEALLHIAVSSGLLDIVNQIQALDQRQGQPLDYRISGKVSVEGYLRAIPFERNGRLGTAPGPRPGSKKPV